MNCGVCTAICPSAEFYNYDPRIIADTVQRQDEESIEGLLKSDTIWYCGECRAKPVVHAVIHPAESSWHYADYHRKKDGLPNLKKDVSNLP